jgi:hypothetical protein
MLEAVSISETPINYNELHGSLSQKTAIFTAVKSDYIVLIYNTAAR